MTRPVKIVIASVTGVLLFGLGLFLGCGNWNVPEPAPASPENANAVKTPPVREPSPSASGYAPDAWKTWRDGDYSKDAKTYHGYEVRYPRDFDVFQGDQASGGLIGRTRVKIAFPQDAFQTPKSNYNEAFMTVSEGDDKASVRDCFVNPNPAGGEKNLGDTIEIDSTVFHQGFTTGAGAGNLYSTALYRTLRDDRCYEVALTVHTGNIGNYDPGTVVEFDQKRATVILGQMLQTFKLTDTSPQY